MTFADVTHALVAALNRPVTVAEQLAWITIIGVIACVIDRLVRLQDRLFAYQLHAAAHAAECPTCRFLLEVDEVDGCCFVDEAILDDIEKQSTTRLKH